MSTVAVRAAPVLAATESPTVPLELPLWPDVMVTHGALLDADHAHPAIVVTPTDNRPPAAPTVSPLLLSVKTQGAAAWLTGSLCGPTDSAALRGEGAGFGATE